MSRDGTFAEAIAVQQIDSHTYSARFGDAWCIGSVPHGGFVTSVFLQVATNHFKTTLSKQRQPHTITLHLEFLRRTNAGSAEFKVRDVKLGQRTSTIHVTLHQGDREEVVGYITNSNMDNENGLSLAVDYQLHPPPVPADIKKLQNDTDPGWALQEDMNFAAFRKASSKLKFYYPRNGQLHRSLADEWIRFESGEKFTNESVGFVADMWPQVVEGYREDNQSGVRLQNKDNPEDLTKPTIAYWYPTLLLNLDIKKKLPAEGVDWLMVRVRAKQIQKGRMDLEVVVLDETGDIVALSHHVSFILSAARNVAKRKGSGAVDSKM